MWRVLILALATLAVTATLPQPIYTIHYLRSYRSDQINRNFGCGSSVVYGTYLHPLGPVDGLYALLNGHTYQGLNPNCGRKETYVKVFGDAQDYEDILMKMGDVAGSLNRALGRSSTKNIIIEWKYKPDTLELLENAHKALDTLVRDLAGKGFQVIVKAPASYFCLDVRGKKYILDITANTFIVELYGEEAGQYTTYESVFGSGQFTMGQGYSACPKFPTKKQIESVASGKTIYLEKTLDYTQPGFIGPKWEEFLDKAGLDAFGGKYFYDSYPYQTVDL